MVSCRRPIQKAVLKAKGARTDVFHINSSMFFFSICNRGCLRRYPMCKYTRTGYIAAIIIELSELHRVRTNDMRFLQASVVKTGEQLTFKPSSGTGRVPIDSGG